MSLILKSGFTFDYDNLYGEGKVTDADLAFYAEDLKKAHEAMKVMREKGFIRAEVIAYEDFIQFKGENGAKDAGKWRLEGKDYIVQDGDVMHFRFNV